MVWAWIKCGVRNWAGWRGLGLEVGEMRGRCVRGQIWHRESRIWDELKVFCQQHWCSSKPKANDYTTQLDLSRDFPQTIISLSESIASSGALRMPVQE